MENINQHAEFLPPDLVTRKFSPDSVLPQQNQKEKKKETEEGAGIQEEREREKALTKK